MKIARPSLGSLRLAGRLAVLVLAAATRAQDSGLPNITVERASRAAIFFPPFPPALDQPVSRTAPSSAGLPAPEGLAQYVGEIFYPQLSSRLLANSLSGKLRQQLADYRAARRALATELEQALTAARDDEPDARRARLQALARQQASRLASLEKSAEQLRADLIAGDRNWSDFREWHLGDPERRGFSPLEIGQVMRAYAHYQKGFLPQQRRLLREIAVELAMAAESAEKAAAVSPYVFFSPEPARVIFPDAPAPVAAKIAAYLTKKSRLKKELYDAVYKHDGRNSIFNQPLRGIAERQAPALAELETLAEEIRVGLAPLTARPPEPPRSPLPQSVVAKFGAFSNRRAALEQEARARIDAVLDRISQERAGFRVHYRFDDTGLKFVIVPLNPRADAQRAEAVRAEIAAIAENYGRALADQINEGLALRQEAADLLGQNNPAAIDAAIAQSLRLAAQRESAELHRHYRIAVFEPGLSPEQRRLLFDVTIEALNLPLPRGDLQPQRRGDSW